MTVCPLEMYAASADLCETLLELDDLLGGGIAEVEAGDLGDERVM